MATLSLRISIPEKNATKMMQFDPSTSVYDACRIIREKLAEATNMGQRKRLIFYPAPKSNVTDRSVEIKYYVYNEIFCNVHLPKICAFMYLGKEQIPFC